MLLLLLGLVVYFLPTIVAGAREKKNGGAIFVLNLFLGWSLVGWVVALVWAVSADPPAPGVQSIDGGLAADIADAAKAEAEAVPVAAKLVAAVTTRPTSEILKDMERLTNLHAGGYLDAGEFDSHLTALRTEMAANVGHIKQIAASFDLAIMEAEDADHHDADHEHHARVERTPIGIGACAIETHIKYHDAHGDGSFRPVTIHTITSGVDGVIYLGCYCKLRHAPRVFRADRIDCFADDNGEIIPARDFLAKTLKVGLRADSIRTFA